MRSPRIVHALIGVVLVAMLLPRGAQRRVESTMGTDGMLADPLRTTEGTTGDAERVSISHWPPAARPPTADDGNAASPLLLDLALHEPPFTNVWSLVARQQVMVAGGGRPMQRRRPLCDCVNPDAAPAAWPAAAAAPLGCEWNTVAVPPRRRQDGADASQPVLDDEVPPHVLKMRRVYGGMQTRVMQQRASPHDPFVPLGVADANRGYATALSVQSVAPDALVRNTALLKAVAVVDAEKLIQRVLAAPQPPPLEAAANLSVGSRAVLAWGRHLRTACTTAGFTSWMANPTQCLRAMHNTTTVVGASVDDLRVGRGEAHGIEDGAAPLSRSFSLPTTTVVFLGHSHQRLFAAMLCMMWNLTSCHVFRKMIPLGSAAAFGGSGLGDAVGTNHTMTSSATAAIELGDDVATWRLHDEDDRADDGRQTFPSAPPSVQQPNVVLAFVKSVFDVRDRLHAIDDLLLQVAQKHSLSVGGGVGGQPLVPDLIVYGRGPWDLVFTDTPMGRFMDETERGLLAMHAALVGSQAATAVVLYLLHATQPEHRGGPRSMPNASHTATEPSWQWVLRNVCLGRHRVMRLRTATICAIKRAAARSDASFLARLRVFDVLAETSALPSHLNRRFVDYDGHHYLDVVLETLVAKFLRQHVCPRSSGRDAFGVHRSHRAVLEEYLRSVSDEECAALRSEGTTEHREPRCACRSAAATSTYCASPKD